jgi:hypothetical protein
MIKSVRDNYKIYGLIIAKTKKKSLVLNYGLWNITFEPPNHDFAHVAHVFVEIYFIGNMFKWNMFWWIYVFV